MDGAQSRTGAIVPGAFQKGRAALSNPANRFESAIAEPFDDGWDTLSEDLVDMPPIRTQLIREASRSALTYNDSPDIGFDRSLNPYRGCEHGCIYCYARPSHAYLGFSPGLDFETKLMFKPDMAALLEKELSKPGYVPRPVALGANTDPYQPVERRLRLTREVLEVLERFNHPVTVVTKSAGVLRDIDILARMAERNLAQVAISVTTLDSNLARRMEPRAATPMRRIGAIAELSRAGIPTAVLAAPMIPAINDMELERILSAGANAGAKRAGYVLLRLPLELRQIFEEWVQKHFPDRARKVLSLIRDTRGGATYQSDFHTRQTGTGVYAGLLAQRFARSVESLGLVRRGGGTQGLDCSHFQVPGTAVQPALL
ncbi:PA0069 family radical SAM protein [Rhodovarius crocodyli]|uniref:PA0069 family radical SAM protein n=1 Tax=Rhodovarius crocodyli TaxID=1979269 RepID=A0A437MFJ6_9PROT|nr:PA0069 family radical SAM protein [Rhodovarius crocodyli]RVT96412.1 PA0069 family radical SAM protein [Rhodovarius crocodyli]